MSEAAKQHRPIRSFVRREGRFTAAQQRAVELLMPRYGVPEGRGTLDLAQLFGRAAPVHLEIGFGNGDALAAMAAMHPENDYLGIEVHRPGVGALLRRLEVDGLANVRVASTDAVQFIGERLPDESLDAVYLFFPDPWPKKRHHKRRIVQAEFVQRVRQTLRIGGEFRLATDWADYAQWMLAVLTDAEGFDNTAGPGRFAPRPAARPLTRFERRGQRLGHEVWDLAFVRAR